MNNADLEQLRYPIGRYAAPQAFTEDVIAAGIRSIAAFPTRLEATVQQLNDRQLDTPYRPGGWTVRQVIHHCADSHMNSYIRFRLALTEERPTIKPYFEERWAELADARSMPITPSLELLKGLHARWAALLQSLDRSQLECCFIHPESASAISLQACISMYAWHGEHHRSQIERLLARS